MSAENVLKLLTKMRYILASRLPKHLHNTNSKTSDAIHDALNKITYIEALNRLDVRKKYDEQVLEFVKGFRVSVVVRYMRTKEALIDYKLDSAEADEILSALKKAVAIE